MTEQLKQAAQQALKVWDDSLTPLTTVDLQALTDAFKEIRRALTTSQPAQATPDDGFAVISYQVNDIEFSPEAAEAASKQQTRYAEVRRVDENTVDIGRVWSFAQATPEPVGEVVYQLQSGDGKWIDQTRASYDYNVKHGNTVRVLHTHPAPGVPEVHKIDVGFRWDGEAQQHIPSMVIEFEPVKAGDPNDAKGWRDRDALAAMLAAAQAKGADK